MDFDVPTDLIDKAQIGFREAAGLSLFDREDTTLPSIPTVEASISTLDPSPPHLRCKYCHGKLLRGLQSFICIYCGEYQRNDRNPDPISFNSTHGYSWLLQSLNFNGSERIGSLAEGSEINGGQSPAEDELTLSEFLDLKLIWRDVPKKPEIGLHFNTSEHSSSSNLGTADFDNFFTESKRAAIVSDIPEEEPVASKNDLHLAFEGQENLTSVASSIDEHDDASFGWNAEFQSADMKMENEKPESVDLFAGAEADLSAQMDTVFGPMEGFADKNPNDSIDPFQDDLFENLKSASFQQAEQLDSVVEAKDNVSRHLNDVNTKDLDGDWFSDCNWQKNSAENTLGQPSDSSVDWFENTNWQKSSTTDKMGIINDDNLLDIKPQVDLILSEKSDLNNSDKHHSDTTTDWFQDSEVVIGGSSSTTNMMASNGGDDADGFDEWNDFTSSMGNQASFQESCQENSNGKVGTSENISDLNLFPSTADPEEVDFGNFLQSDVFSGDKLPNDTRENISDLNLFPSTADPKEVDFGNFLQSDVFSGDKLPNDTRVCISDLNLFPSTADPKEGDFGNFLQSDVFSGDKLPNDTRVAHDIFSEVSTATWKANAVAGNSTEGTKDNETTPNATTSPNKDVQMLLSQMHDLSFMLKSELSIPSKADDLGSSHT